MSSDASAEGLLARAFEYKALEQFRAELRKNKVLSCVILQHDSVVFEYYRNRKEARELQKINSATKSFVSALVGICLDRGLIPSVETPISEYFGSYLASEADPRKGSITVADLLTMSAGFDWPEFGEWNYFAPFVYSSDPIRFILERDLVDEPSTRMNYNSGCSHLLGAIIQQVTEQKVEDFAREALFEPLGITAYKWYDWNGQNLTSDGLRVKTVDMVKLGQLFLHNGVYNGKRILSAEYVAQATKPRYLTYDQIGSYGYQWWISSVTAADNSEISFYFALGYQGQYIIAVPSLDMAIAITSRLDKTLMPLEIVKAFISEHMAGGCPGC